MPVASTPRALQRRLTLEFGGRDQVYPEPVVERWSPATSMLITLGSGAALWALLVAGARLALH